MFITANTLRVENGKLYGTILWKREFGSKRVAGVRITFNGEPIDDLSLIFRSVFREATDVTENTYKMIVSDGISLRTFTRAIVEIFAAIFNKIDE